MKNILAKLSTVIIGTSIVLTGCKGSMEVANQSSPENTAVEASETTSEDIAAEPTFSSEEIAEEVTTISSLVESTETENNNIETEDVTAETENVTLETEDETEEKTAEASYTTGQPAKPDIKPSVNDPDPVTPATTATSKPEQSTPEHTMLESTAPMSTTAPHETADLHETVDQLETTESDITDSQETTVSEPTTVEMTSTSNNETVPDPSVEAGHEHVFGDWQVTKRPTCVKEGIRVRYCRICGISQGEYMEPNKKNHSMSEGYGIVKEPTFFEEGLARSRCYLCDYYVDEVLPKLDPTIDGTSFSVCLGDTALGRSESTPWLPCYPIDHTKAEYSIECDQPFIDYGNGNYTFKNGAEVTFTLKKFNDPELDATYVTPMVVHLEVYCEGGLLFGDNHFHFDESSEGYEFISLIRKDGRTGNIY